MLNCGFVKSRTISGCGRDDGGGLGVVLAAGAAVGLCSFMCVAVAASRGEGLSAQGCEAWRAWAHLAQADAPKATTDELLVLDMSPMG